MRSWDGTFAKGGSRALNDPGDGHAEGIDWRFPSLPGREASWVLPIQPCLIADPTLFHRRSYPVGSKKSPFPKKPACQIAALLPTFSACSLHGIPRHQPVLWRTGNPPARTSHFPARDFHRAAPDFHRATPDFHRATPDFHRAAPDFHRATPDFHRAAPDFHRAARRFFHK